MKPVYLIIVVLLTLPIAVGAASGPVDFSTVQYKVWPSNVYRPPMPTSAYKIQAPAGAITQVTRATKGPDFGTNSKPIWVWVKDEDCEDRIVHKILRLGSCGNPAVGNWTTYKPKPQLSYSGQPQQRVVAVQQVQVKPIVMPQQFGSGINPGYQFAPAYIVRTSENLVFAGVFWRSHYKLTCPPRTCPIVGKPPAPPPPGAVP